MLGDLDFHRNLLVAISVMHRVRRLMSMMVLGRHLAGQRTWSSLKAGGKGLLFRASRREMNVDVIIGQTPLRSERNAV